MSSSIPQSKTISLLSLLLDKSFHTKSLKSTKTLHAHLLKTSLFTHLHLHLHTKLFLSYAACPNNLPSITNLLSSLDPNGNNPFPWNAVVSAFSRHGFSSLALRTVSLMHKLALPLDTYTLCSALTATAGAIELGRKIHTHALKSGCISSIFVGGALVNFYAKSRETEDARKMFDEIPIKNLVCANALLAGYVECRLWVEALSLLQRMHLLKLELDGFTLSAVLRICAETSDAELGMQAHAHLIRRIYCIEHDVFLQSSLVEMYGKSGLVHKAQLVFELAGRKGERKRDVVLWTSMLNAYGRNGRFDSVIEAFEEMLIEGTEPDKIAFLAVLSACSHMGRVIRGLNYFESMRRDYGIVPSSEHYGCVVDMLCRAGDLEKAWKFANEMVDGGGFSVSVWVALLSACKDSWNVEIGKVAAQRALELDPANVGIYVELSNLYARVGMWDEIGKLRELIKERGLKKYVGCSRLELTKLNVL